MERARPGYCTRGDNAPAVIGSGLPQQHDDDDDDDDTIYDTVLVRKGDEEV